MSPRSKSSSSTWLIELPTGKQIGPYATDAVLKLISDGTLKGLERIKKYPEGKWIPISKEPDFYDQLLAALESALQKKKSKPSSSSPNKGPEIFSPNPKLITEDDETVIMPPPDADEELTVPRKSINKKDTADSEDITKTRDTVTAGSDQDNYPQLTETPDSAADSKLKLELPPPPTIELDRMEDLTFENQKRKLKAPFYILALALILAAVAVLYPEVEQKTEESKNHLLAPRPTTTVKLSPQEIKSAMDAAVSAFVKDSYETYLEAQGRLVSLIEGAPSNAEAKGLLCLTYKELWPYVEQGSQDLDAVNYMTKTARTVDPVGVNAYYCETMKFMVMGKYKEARGVLEYALNQPALSTAPVLYALKGELLAEEGDYQTAILYTDKARQLWPSWAKPAYDQATYYLKVQDKTQARNLLEQTLKLNPKHRRAQIDFGVLLYRGFGQIEDAFRVLSTAVASENMIPRPNLSKGLHTLAQIFLDKKEADKALKYAREAYELNPADPYTKDLLVRLGGDTTLNKRAARNELVFLGDQYFRTGNCLAAQAEYKTAFEVDPTNAVAAMKAAKCLWQLSQSKEAIDWLDKAIKADPKLVMAYVLQADYYSARYSYAQAAQVLSRAANRFPNNHEVLRGFGLVEYRRNNIKDAIAFLSRANKIFENDVETLILLAKAHGQLGEFQDAQKYAVRAIELDSTNNEAQIVYSKILSQFQGLDAGVLYLKDLINRFSYTLEFRVALAELYREQQRYIQAQQIFEQIVAADPKNKKAHIGLGESYQAQGIFDKALKSFLEAAVLDPSDAEGLVRAGLVYLDSQKYSDAIVQFKRAAEVNPQYPRLYYYAGRAALAANEYSVAIQYAEQERKFNPNLADSYILAAEVYTETKQFQKCAEEYQKAIKLRPQGAMIYVKLARCYRQGGSADIAESMLNIAASQESGLPEIYREQGAIFEIKGDKAAAITAYEKYLALSPNAPDRQQIQSLVQSLGGQ